MSAILPQSQQFNHAAKRTAFKGGQECPQCGQSQQPAGFKVNKPLEYTGAAAGHVTGLALLGGIIGGYVAAGLERTTKVIRKGNCIKSVPNEKFLPTMRRFGLWGAAAGAALALATLPWTLNRTRERIYNKECYYKATSAATSDPNKAIEYLNNRALQTAASNMGNNNSSLLTTAAIAGGGYYLGSRSGRK